MGSQKSTKQKKAIKEKDKQPQEEQSEPLKDKQPREDQSRPPGDKRLYPVEELEALGLSTSDSEDMLPSTDKEELEQEAAKYKERDGPEWQTGN